MTSAYAAVVAINRQLPDLVLFSESISDRHRERVVDHLKSVSRSGTPPTLSIPSLLNGDRAALRLANRRIPWQSERQDQRRSHGRGRSSRGGFSTTDGSVAAKSSPSSAPQPPVVEAAAAELDQSSSNCFHRQLPSKP